jgi:branched-chain amino acid transport system substrate-binding protein
MTLKMMRTAAFTTVSATVLTSAAWAQEAVVPVAEVAQAQVVRGVSATGTVSYGTVRGGLEQAVRLMGRGDWQGAADVYSRLVNAGTETEKGQARLGMAAAFAQMGDETRALQALEGTVADGDTPLGRAVGELRGRLILQMAEKDLHAEGVAGAKRWLAQYQRLTIMPERERYVRLLAAVSDEGAKHPQTLTVGVLLPLSGPMKPVGDAVMNGLALAVSEGFVWQGVDVVLKPYDVAAGGEEGATQAAQAALDEGADVLVGPLLSKHVDGVAPLAVARNVPVLGLSSDRAAAREGVWLAGYLAADQGRAAANHAKALGLTRVAGLVPSNPYGYELFDAFKEQARLNGLDVVKTAFYNPQNVDLGANIRTLTEGMAKGGPAPFEALFIPAPAQSLPLIFSQLVYYDLDRGMQLLGTALWQHNAVLSPTSRELVGGVFAVPADNTIFNDRYQSVYGTRANQMALVGYDLGGWLGELAFERGRTGAPLAEVLTRPDGFYGTGGYVRFFANGLNERGMDLMRVGDGKFDVLGRAALLRPVPVPANLTPEGVGRGGIFWRQ